MKNLQHCYETSKHWKHTSAAQETYSCNTGTYNLLPHTAMPADLMCLPARLIGGWRWQAPSTTTSMTGECGGELRARWAASRRAGQGKLLGRQPPWLWTSRRGPGTPVNLPWLAGRALGALASMTDRVSYLHGWSDGRNSLHLAVGWAWAPAATGARFFYWGRNQRVLPVCH
jgi:hypothetical protein